MKIAQDSQQQLQEMINADGGAKMAQTSQVIKQELYNDNRRMMMEIMAPLSQQLMEM